MREKNTKCIAFCPSNVTLIWKYVIAHMRAEIWTFEEKNIGKKLFINLFGCKTSYG